MAAEDPANDERVGPRPEEEEEEDVALMASISLPATSIKRIARSAAPGVRFSSEAIAGLHRVAQAFVCFATDRSLQEMKVEADRANRKQKGKTFVAK